MERPTGAPVVRVRIHARVSLCAMRVGARVSPLVGCGDRRKARRSSPLNSPPVATGSQAAAPGCDGSGVVTAAHRAPEVNDSVPPPPRSSVVTAVVSSFLGCPGSISKPKSRFLRDTGHAQIHSDMQTPPSACAITSPTITRLKNKYNSYSIWGSRHTHWHSTSWATPIFDAASPRLQRALILQPNGRDNPNFNG